MVEIYITEEGKDNSLLNANGKENGAMNGELKVPLSRRSSEYLKNGCCGFFRAVWPCSRGISPDVSPASMASILRGSAWKNTCLCKSEKGKWAENGGQQMQQIKNKYLCFRIVMLIFLLLVLITTIVLLVGRKFEKCTVLHLSVLADPCPNGWIGYQKKCYYFSETEGNWTSSSTHCSSYNASLALVDSQEEMDFLLRYKTSSDHWIGLQKDSGQSWKWVNGSIYKGWLRTDGGRRCAYLTHGIIASSSCTREEHWICSKEMAKVIAQIVEANP